MGVTTEREFKEVIMKLLKSSIPVVIFLVTILSLPFIWADNTEAIPAITVCDDHGMTWKLTIISSDAIHGTAGPVPCDGSTVLVTGGYRGGLQEGAFFTLYADQAPSGSCTEGFIYIGAYTGGRASGHWYNSPDYPASGTFTMGPCGSVSQSSEGPLPGVIE